MAAVTPVAAGTPDAAGPGADAAAIEASWRDGDRFAAIYDRYAAQLYRYAYQRVGPQAAEDVVAETFLAAFQGRISYDLTRADARPWLFGILTRKLARHHRAERADYRAVVRAAGRSGPDAPDDGPADRVAARVSADAARAPLAAALAGLSRGDRDVLLLVAWGQLSYDEVATALKIPLGTVRSRLNRARRKVRTALGGVNPTHQPEAEE
jgi:RNA polymerase sigma factor (sigma-70 family)